MSTLRIIPSPPICTDAGLLFLRVASAFMLLYVHGWPKVADYGAELARIEDPFGMGAAFSLWAAILAEVLCPLLVAAGILTRFFCLPILVVLMVAMLIVHRDWSLAEGQFGWLLAILFVTIALCGPGKWSLDARLRSCER